MPRLLAQVVAASLLVMASCGGDEESPAPAQRATPTAAADETVAFPLGAERGSGVSGNARIAGGDAGFTVTLRVKRPADSGPAHIHDVTCEEYRATTGFDAQLATVDTPLTDVQGGRSTTEVPKPLSDFRTAGFSINVHSTKAGFPVVACGDVPAG